MDISDIKLGNIKEVLNCIRAQNRITKKEIALRTGLSFSTVSTVCNALCERGILSEKKAGNGTVGRKPSLLIMQYDHFLTLCLNIQRRDIMEFAILDYRNNLLLHERYNISHINGIREIATYANGIFAQKRKLPQFEHSKFIGVGVIVSGIFDKHTEIILNSAIVSMEGAPVKAVIEDVFQMPCYVDNESNLCAISVQQTHPDMNDFLYLHISQGVGIGIVTNGALLNGYNGYGGEIAHFPLGDPKKRCPVCKNYGCIEMELSIASLLHNGIWHETTESVEKQWAEMSQAIQKTPSVYADFLQEKGQLMGKLLSVLIDLFDPQAVFVGGEISSIFEQIRPYAEEAIYNHCFMVRDRILPLQCDLHSDFSMILGLNYVMCEKWEPLNGKLY